MTHDTSSTERPWIGVDLDGTLARYDGYSVTGNEIGDPVPAMAARVLRWLNRGIEVRCVTARASTKNPNREADVARVQEWLWNHFQRDIPVTAEKDFAMVALYDDRAITVEENTGYRLARTGKMAMHSGDPLTLREELELGEGSANPEHELYWDVRELPMGYCVFPNVDWVEWNGWNEGPQPPAFTSDQ